MRLATYTLVALGVMLTQATNADSGTVEATYYGAELDGNPTASGETFRASGHTAAHPTLPFGTQLRVCKDACTTVRVNDRPDNNTQLDLSEGAARTIGLKSAGRAPVSVEQTSSKPSTELPKTGGIGG